MFSKETLNLFLDLMSDYVLVGSDPQFEAKAMRIIEAKRTIEAALKQDVKENGVSYNQMLSGPSPTTPELTTSDLNAFNVMPDITPNITPDASQSITPNITPAVNSADIPLVNTVPPPVLNHNQSNVPDNQPSPMSYPGMPDINSDPSSAAPVIGFF